MANPGPARNTSPKTTANLLYDTADTMRALNCSRWKIWQMCRNEPESPKPRDIAGKNAWFAAEIEAYKASRPVRQYADSAA